MKNTTLVITALLFTACDGTPDLPPCGPGTYEFQGICLPIETEPPCGPGTHDINGVCVADVTPPAKTLVCGEGTKELNNTCVSLDALENDQICMANNTLQWCYPDKDRDGWGATAGAKKHCAGTCGLFNMAAKNGDCDDSNGSINPNAMEVCDSKDNNCNGQVDETDPSMGEYCETLLSLWIGGVNKIVPTRGQLYCAHWPEDQGLFCTPNYQLIETCGNNVDDNGNGLVDEGCLGAPCQNDSECSSALHCSNPTLTTDGKPGGVCAFSCKTDADCPNGDQCFVTWVDSYAGKLRFSCFPAK